MLSQRLGAALTLSRIYREFRESAPLVQEFTLELMDQMLFCLKLADADPTALDAGRRAQDVLQSLVKVIADPRRGHWAALLAESVDRAGAEHCRSLPRFARWLCDQLASTETVYRRQCRALLERLAPLCLSAPAPAQAPTAAAQPASGKFVRRSASTNPAALAASASAVPSSQSTGDKTLTKWISQTFPPSTLARQQLLTILDVGGRLKVSSVASLLQFAGSDLFAWLEALSGALDNYSWLLHGARVSAAEAVDLLAASTLLPAALMLVNGVSTHPSVKV